jgi:PAS domain S-box-containing protein
MWGAINFGIAGATLTVFLIASMATVLTALGLGPFSANTPLVNALLLDILFALLSVSGLSLAAVIAERERAESAHQQLARLQTDVEAARRQLAAVVESCDDAILSENLDGTILSWNGGASRIFGFSEAEAIGQPIERVIPPALWGDEKLILQRIAVGDRVARAEASLIPEQGETIHLSTTISPLTDATGDIVGAARVVRDMSDQKHAEQALSLANRRLIDAQEQERARIARELHDDIVQRLAVVAMKLTGEQQAQAAEIAADVQALSHRLHPSKIELVGLVPAMRSFCNEFADQQQIAVTFASDGSLSNLPSGVGICLFRVLQEALHNSAKHSGVRQSEVRLWEAADTVHLVVSDAGVGFNLHMQKARGIGLLSMQERITLAGGQISIESQPNRGTTIHARVPIPSSPAVAGV